MGIEVLDRNGGKDKHCRMLFMCDTEADIADLPTEEKVGSCGKCCASGSIAIIADTKEKKMLNTQGEWV